MGFSFPTQQISAVTTHPLISKLVGWTSRFALTFLPLREGTLLTPCAEIVEMGL